MTYIRPIQASSFRRNIEELPLVYPLFEHSNVAHDSWQYGL